VQYSIGFARELDREPLWLTGTELILRIHEHGRDAIFEVADEIDIAWEMHLALSPKAKVIRSNRVGCAIKISYLA
jgi:hypothetical protein